MMSNHMLSKIIDVKESGLHLKIAYFLFCSTTAMFQVYPSIFYYAYCFLTIRFYT